MLLTSNKENITNLLFNNGFENFALVTERKREDVEEASYLPRALG